MGFLDYLAMKVGSALLITFGVIFILIAAQVHAIHNTPLGSIILGSIGMIMILGYGYLAGW